MSIDPHQSVPPSMGAVIAAHRVVRSRRIVMAFMVGGVVWFLGWLGAEYVSALADQRELLRGPLRLGAAVGAVVLLVWLIWELRRAVVAHVWLTEAGIHVRDLKSTFSVRWSDVRAVRFSVWRSTVDVLVLETSEGDVRLPRELERTVSLLKAARDRGLVDDRGLPRPVLMALDALERSGRE